MPSKTKVVTSARKSTSVSQTLMNQRLVIWLLVGFVAFLTLWMLYTVKAMQAGSMTTSTEAFSTPVEDSSCTPSDLSRGTITSKKVVNGRVVKKTLTCCKVPGTSQYYWRSMSCSLVNLNDGKVDAKPKPAYGGVMKPR